MKTRSVVLWSIFAALLIQLPLFAHHSSAAFDSGKKLVLKGTVVEWVYANPHCMLIFDVKGEKGEVVHWTTETQAPASVFPAGYRKDSFKPGHQVTITVLPFKDGTPYGRIVQAVLDDGKVLGSVETPAEGAPPRP